MTIDLENKPIDLTDVEPVEPKNPRLCMEPYPHLRDDEGCILAMDYAHKGKIAYLLRTQK